MAVNNAFLGSGHLTIVPTIVNPTPIQVARMTDISVKFAKDTKALEADRIAALGKAWVGLTAKLTAKTVEWNVDAVAAILSGAATASEGRLIGVDGEACAVPAATPWTVTIANPTGFVNLGIEDVTAGIAAGVRRFMSRVASAPTTGQYSVTSGGVYTFAAADASHALRARYYYSDAVVGRTIRIQNVQQRIDTPFIATLFNTNATGKDLGFRFPEAYCDTFGINFKMKDWAENDVEFDCLGDSNDDIAYLYQS